MKTKSHISHQQLICMVIVFAQVATIIFLPETITRLARENAWLSVGVGAVIGGGPVVLCLGLLARRHPHMNLGEIAELCLGRWGSKLVTLTIAAFSIFLASLTIRDANELTITVILSRTPPLVAALLYVATVVYMVYTGIETMGRYAVVVLVLTMVALSLLLVGIPQEVDTARIRPFAADGLGPVFAGAWPAAGWFGEVWIFGQIMGFVRRPKHVLKGLTLGVSGSTVLLMMLLCLTILVFGAPLVQTFTFPALNLFRQVSIGQFMERLEIGPLTVWLCGMLLKTGICIWVCCVSLSQLFGVQNFRFFIVPVAVGSLWLSLLWPSLMALVQFSSGMWTPGVMPIEVGVPLLLLIVSWIRNRSSNRGVAA